MQNDLFLITLGGLLLLGLLTETLGRHTPLPRVTLLILFGILIGPSAFDLIPVAIEPWYDLIADMALLMIGFLLGSKLSYRKLREIGNIVLWISMMEVAGVAALIFLGLTALGFDPIMALLLAGIAPASAPAAIFNVVDEANSNGKFTDILLDTVAIDDAWGLIVFILLLATAQALNGSGITEALQFGARELFGAALLGILIGLPASYLTGRIKPGEPTMIEALGLVFLTGGLAQYLEVSFLLSAMVAGAVIVNLAYHHTRPFREIRNIEWPFMILFFVLAGASLEVSRLAEIGLAGFSYIVLRIAGLSAGGWLGGLLGGSDPVHRRWIGLAITPQAGVALGMALLAGNSFPELRERIIAIVIGTTVVFELIGPVLTRIALQKTDLRRN